MKSVQLLATCLVDTFLPSAGQAVKTVLEQLGLQVRFARGQTCCGQPAYNAGMRREARRMAEHTLKTLESDSMPVVVPSGSCTAMIRHGYPELFSADPSWLARARELAGRTFEFSQFLVDELGVTDLKAEFRGRVTYHPSCHLSRELQVDRQPKALLAHVRDAEVVPLPEAHECCGFGGVFSAEHPEISGAMLARKLQAIDQSDAPLVVTCDAGCLMQIQGGLLHAGRPQRVAHLAEVLAGSLDPQSGSA
jgi:L-lactate dehydrogenase complex protein LldE